MILSTLNKMFKQKKPRQGELTPNRAEIYEKAKGLLDDEHFDAVLELLSSVGDTTPKKIDTQILELRARAFVGQEYWDQALSCLEKILAAEPEHLEAIILKGVVLKSSGGPSVAIGYYKTFLERNPNSKQIWLDLAKVYYEKKDFTLALRAARRSSEFDLTESEPYVQIGLIYWDSKKIALAEKYFRKAFELDKNNFRAIEVWAWMEAYNENLTQLREILNIEVAEHLKPKLYLLAGDTLGLLFENQEAELAYKNCLRLMPDNYRAWCNLGIVFRNTGRVVEALESINKSIEIKPGYGFAYWHRSLCYLLQHKYEMAWEGYEYRTVCGDFSVRKTSLPQWQGEALDGEMLLVYSEQGLGDEIMFSSCVPELRKRCGNLMLECSEKLAPLFRRSFPDVRVEVGSRYVKLDNLPFVNDADYAVPMGSLPRFFRRDSNWPGTTKPFLKADPDKLNYWRKKLDALPGRLKVGISWRGGVKLSRSALRSINLNLWVPILSNSECDFISLQYGEQTPEEIGEIESKGLAIHHWQEAIDDYDKTAALVSALDLVISVQTAVVHLGGALGQEVWALIPCCPEWRYGIDGDTMDWYSSVSLIRQKGLGEWAGVVREVEDKLNKKIAILEAQ